MRIVKFKNFFSINENINDTPEEYIKVVLLQIKKKLEKMFETDDTQEVRKFSEEEPGTTSFADMGVELESIEMSRYSKTLDNVKIKFSDEEFLYDLLIGIDIKEAVPKQDQKFDIKDIKKCFIKFKKYDKHDPGEILGELTDNIKIEEISQELLIELKLKLDEQSGDEEEEEFKIETE
jgi:hypothetical protein